MRREENRSRNAPREGMGPEESKPSVALLKLEEPARLLLPLRRRAGW